MAHEKASSAAQKQRYCVEEGYLANPLHKVRLVLDVECTRGDVDNKKNRQLAHITR